MAKMDVLGKRFGRLVVLRRKGDERPLRYQVVCACDCGKEWSGYLYSLTAGYTKSCGCFNAEVSGGRMRGIPKYRDITGLRVGRLVVSAKISVSKDRQAMWLCKCDCGETTELAGSVLWHRGVKSCGCLQRDTAKKTMTRHGQYLTPTYGTWEGMIGRCTNSRSRAYKHYGGRGITVCDRWLSFENFLADMGERPVRMTLDRKDNNGNYEPGNCRWATQAEQMRNLRRNRWYEMDGRKQILPDWAKEYDINLFTLRSRLSKGWPLERALSVHLAR